MTEAILGKNTIRSLFASEEIKKRFHEIQAKKLREREPIISYEPKKELWDITIGEAWEYIQSKVKPYLR